MRLSGPGHGDFQLGNRYEIIGRAIGQNGYIGPGIGDRSPSCIFSRSRYGEFRLRQMNRPSLRAGHNGCSHAFPGNVVDFRFSGLKLLLPLRIFNGKEEGGDNRNIQHGFRFVFQLDNKNISAFIIGGRRNKRIPGTEFGGCLYLVVLRIEYRNRPRSEIQRPITVRIDSKNGSHPIQAERLDRLLAAKNPTGAFSILIIDHPVTLRIDREHRCNALTVDSAFQVKKLAVAHQQLITVRRFRYRIDRRSAHKKLKCLDMFIKGLHLFFEGRHPRLQIIDIGPKLIDV